MLYWSGEKYVFCGSFKSVKKFGPANRKSTNPKKIGSANRKAAKCHISRKSASLANYLSPHICGLVIFGTYLRTAYLWISVIALMSKIATKISKLFINIKIIRNTGHKMWAHFCKIVRNFCLIMVCAYSSSSTLLNYRFFHRCSPVSRNSTDFNWRIQ